MQRIEIPIPAFSATKSPINEMYSSSIKPISVLLQATPSLPASGSTNAPG